jgi:hypothetical protein
MKPKINVKKYGNTATIYIADIATGAAHSISSFDDEPEGAFPQTIGIHKLYEQYGDLYEFNFLEKPVPNLPNSKRAKVSTEELERIRTTGSADVLPINGASTFVPPPVANSSAETLRALELMIVKLSVAEGRKLKELQAEYAAVKKFIVRLSPNLAGEIEQLEMRHE